MGQSPTPFTLQQWAVARRLPYPPTPICLPCLPLIGLPLLAAAGASSKKLAPAFYDHINGHSIRLFKNAMTQMRIELHDSSALHSATQTVCQACGTEQVPHG
uniref:Uncharacterized protein n=1 Tax=Eutreptiella gymnastica TaxID=73025 RepID=A0A7S4G296_9EUGL